MLPRRPRRGGGAGGIRGARNSPGKLRRGDGRRHRIGGAARGRRQPPAAAALPAWLALTCLVPGRMAVRHRTPPALTDIGGNWYLWAVGTQSLAIAATFLWAVGILGARPAALLAIAAWLAGAALYLLITALIVARLLLAGLAPHNPTAPYWVAALPGGIC